MKESKYKIGEGRETQIKENSNLIGRQRILVDKKRKRNGEL
jgi:hypothetical protein